MIKKIIFLIIFISFTIAAQDAGKTGMAFLKIGSSARSIALSDMGILDTDPSSVYYNPAAVTSIEAPSIMFTHQMWIQDVSSEILGANLLLFGLPISVGVNSTKIKGFEIRTVPSDVPEATFNINYFYGNLSTGFTLYEKLDFGVTIKYLYESLLADDASGTGYDFGLIYHDLYKNLTLGASVRNLGNMQKLRNEKTKLPSDLILNAVYEFSIEEASLDLMPLAGIQKYFELEDMHYHIGTEVTYDKIVSLRVGYVTGYESKGFSAGAGFYWQGFNIDYAFTPFSYGIGNANTFSIIYNF